MRLMRNQRKFFFYLSAFFICFIIFLIGLFGVLNPYIKQKNEAKDIFMQQFGKLYGYDGKIELLRKRELQPRLGNDIYLDYTSSGLFQNSQIFKTHELLTSSLFSNTHGSSKSSLATTERINAMRDLILKFFNTDSSKYALIFTSGTTAGLKIIADIVPWDSKSNFLYLRKNHNSVLGIREVVKKQSGNFYFIDETNLTEITNENENFNRDFIGNNSNSSINVFAYPAQENFAGRIYPLSWIEKIQKGLLNPYQHKLNLYPNSDNWLVVLDAAAYVPTHYLDLSLYSPDFVVLSFYKMFGYPTGVGVLLMKKDILSQLRKIYFGGGSIQYTLYDSSWQVFDTDPIKRFEDGTINFYDIFSLQYGFEALSQVGGIKKITNHVNSLTIYLAKSLKSLKHKSTNTPLVILYGNHNQNNDFDDISQGSIVTFNILNSEGNYVNINDFQQLALINNIHIRIGCDCNPGACYDYIGLTCNQVKKKFIEEKEKDSENEVDFINGIPFGAIRLSIGYLTSFEEIEFFIDFLVENFQNK